MSRRASSPRPRRASPSRGRRRRRRIPRRARCRRRRPSRHRPVTNPPVDPTLDLESFAVTLVDQLRVRSQPTVAESSAKLEPLLPAGVRLFVIEESVAADGYAWYHVLPVDPGYPSGWVAAASRDGEPWIEAAPSECPSLPIEPLEMDSLGVYGGLACFGDNEIQLMGEVSCQTADVDLTIGGPSWLRGDRYCTFSGGDGSRQIQDGGAGLRVQAR